MTFYGQDVDNEPPTDPLREEAAEQADEATQSFKEAYQRGDITWEQYYATYEAEEERLYQKFVEMEREAFAATKCDCGGYFEIAYGGCWECVKCKKRDGSCFDDIPF